MLISLIASILLSLIAGFIAINIVCGRVECAKGNVITIDIEQTGEIVTANIVTSTGMTRIARRNVMRSRDITNTWSQL